MKFSFFGQPLAEMVRQEGLEPATYCLEGSCSIQLSYWRIMERVTGIEPASPAWKAGALAVVLHPRHSDKFSLRIIPYRGRSVKGFLLFWGFAAHLALLGGWPNWRR